MSKKYKKQGQKPLPTSTPILPELDEVSAQESVAVIQSVRIDYRVNPKFCVTAKLWCKIEQKCFKAGAAQAAAAFSTKITAL